MRIRIVSLIILFTGVTTCPQAQYVGGESALGIRVGGAAGITYKNFLNRTFALEGLLSQNFDPHIKSISITGLLENHAPIAGNRFSAMVGLGPSFIFKDSRFGAAGILGFDWRIGVLPLNLQADWLPGYFFVNDNRLNASNVAVSLRYILNHKRINGTTNPAPPRQPQPVPPSPPQQ